MTWLGEGETLLDYRTIGGDFGSEIRVRLDTPDCKAEYQNIDIKTDVTIDFDDGGTGHNQTYQLLNNGRSFLELRGGCAIFMNLRFEPTNQGIIDMKFKKLTITAQYDNQKVAQGERKYIWSTDSYIGIREPMDGSIKVIGGVPSDAETPVATTPLATTTDASITTTTSTVQTTTKILLPPCLKQLRKMLQQPLLSPQILPSCLQPQLLQLQSLQKQPQLLSPLEQLRLLLILRLKLLPRCLRLQQLLQRQAQIQPLNQRHFRQLFLCHLPRQTLILSLHPRSLFQQCNHH